MSSFEYVVIGVGCVLAARLSKIGAIIMIGEKAADLIRRAGEAQSP